MSRSLKVTLAAASCMGMVMGGVAPSLAQNTLPEAQGSASATELLQTPGTPEGQPGTVTPASVDATTPVASLEPPMPSATIPAAYLAGSARLPDQVISDWLADTKSVTAVNPHGGLVMVDYVTLLVGSDNRTPLALTSLSMDPAITPAQQAAFGTGMARAAQLAQSVAPEYAGYILETVAKFGSPRLIAAFQNALSQTATAALGAGASAGGQTDGGGLTGGGVAGPSGSGDGSETFATTSGSSDGGRGGSASFSEGDSSNTTIIIVQSPAS